MDFHLLGPLEVLRNRVPVQIAAGKQRALLAILLLNRNRIVSRERLLDDLWGENVPESARKMVQIHVSHLRKAPPPAATAYPPPRLHDRARRRRTRPLPFRALGHRGAGGTLSRGDAERATELLRDALSLWRGPSLAEFPEPFGRHESARLEELRLAALE